MVGAAEAEVTGAAAAKKLTFGGDLNKQIEPKLH